jgi:hypothetical protein
MRRRFIPKKWRYRDSPDRHRAAIAHAGRALKRGCSTSGCHAATCRRVLCSFVDVERDKTHDRGPNEGPQTRGRTRYRECDFPHNHLRTERVPSRRCTVARPYSKVSWRFSLLFSCNDLSFSCLHPFGLSANRSERVGDKLVLVLAEDAIPFLIGRPSVALCGAPGIRVIWHVRVLFAAMAPVHLIGANSATVDIAIVPAAALRLHSRNRCSDSDQRTKLWARRCPADRELCERAGRAVNDDRE